MCDFASLARGSITTRTGEALSSFPRDRFAQARFTTEPLHTPVVAPQTWNDDDSLLPSFGPLFGTSLWRSLLADPTCSMHLRPTVVNS